MGHYGLAAAACVAAAQAAAAAAAGGTPGRDADARDDGVCRG